MKNAEVTLTQEEVAALIKPAASDSLGGGADNRQRIVPYNFRRPNRISKEQIRSLYLLHDILSHSLSSSLPIFLRTISEVTLISVDQQAYVEYLYGLPDPTALFTLAMRPLPGHSILEFNPSIAFPLIDRMLGGEGRPLGESRALTELEQKILEGFVTVVLEDLTEAWRPHMALDIQIVGRETRPQLLQIVAPNEVMLSIVFHIQIGEASGTMSLCIPAMSLEPVIQKFNQSVFTRSRNLAPEQAQALLGNLECVEFLVASELHGQKIAMEDLISLVPGDVLQFDLSIEHPLDIRVAGLSKFAGTLVDYHGRRAICVTAKTGEAAAAPSLS